MNKILKLRDGDGRGLLIIYSKYERTEWNIRIKRYKAFVLKFINLRVYN